MEGRHKGHHSDFAPLPCHTEIFKKHYDLFWPTAAEQKKTPPFGGELANSY